MYLDVGLSTRIKVAPPDPTNPPQNPDDGYPDVIADQRHAYKVETVDEVEMFWLDTLERKRLEPWVTDPMTERDAYINRGRYLADCTCNSGAFVWNRNPLGCCLDCGLLFKVRHPSPFVLAAAIRLLAVRPIVNQNWDAHKGETLEELDRDNRWLLNEPSVEKNGLVVPVGLDVPEALAKYIEVR
jgi:hypothetical protein